MLLTNKYVVNLCRKRQLQKITTWDFQSQKNVISEIEKGLLFELNDRMEVKDSVKCRSTREIVYFEEETKKVEKSPQGNTKCSKIFDIRVAKGEGK